MSFAGQARLCSSMLVLALTQPSDHAADRQRYRRPVQLLSPGPACAVLDAAVFAHAAGALKDLRVVSGDRELPYTVAVNQAAQVGNDPATPANLREDADGAEFDLAMPPRPYTQLLLKLQGKDFLAHAHLSGMRTLHDAHPISLGTFTVFDLSSQGLARDTLISLPESSFPFLHLVVRGRGFHVLGVEVPPNREEQTLFTTVAETRNLIQTGPETVATFHVPARVPIERVSTTLAPDFAADFSRNVRVTASAGLPGSLKEQVTGAILRIRTSQIRIDRETLPASLGANLQSDADVQVAIDNAGKPPLPLTAVALAMRQRTICFDVSGPTDLVYGDASLPAPTYAYPMPPAWKLAHLGPEAFNPTFHPPAGRPANGPTQPGKWILWSAGLLLLTSLLGALTLRPSRRRSS